MRVLVCGGRGYRNRDAVWHELGCLAERHGWLTIINGGASGADRLSTEWAQRFYHGLVVFPADWPAHGRAAGPMRNEQMLVSGKPDIVIAFPGGRGPADMVRQARAVGVEVLTIKAKVTA